MDIEIREEKKAKVFDYMDSRIELRDIDMEINSMMRQPWTFDVSYREMEAYVEMYFEQRPK